MKVLLSLLVFICFSVTINAQALYDYKIKDAVNGKERTKILDKIRNQLFKDFKQKFVFNVKKLNVCGNYAWFEGEATNKDGSEVVLNNTEEIPYDCCHVEFLLQKVKGVWYEVSYAAFSTDVWYQGIYKRHKAPRKIYGPESVYD